MSEPSSESPPAGVTPPDFAAVFRSLKHDFKNPDPWLALFLDQSLPMDEQVKAALLLDLRSFSRQFLLPLIRPLARIAIALIQLFKILVPRRFHSSRLLHRLIHWGLRTWVSPQANFLILRHFQVGSDIIGFIASNVPHRFESLTPLRPSRLKDVEDELFLRHDLNLYNFMIELNRQLRESGRPLAPPSKLDYSAVHTGSFSFEPFPDRWTNFLDLASAIEIYTPLYQLFLTDDDFWRASNSLQLDETMAIYVAILLQDSTHLALINNKHPLVPLSTLRAGHRLVLHGLASECLHELLVRHERAEESGIPAGGLRSLWKVEAG